MTILPRRPRWKYILLTLIGHVSPVLILHSSLLSNENNVIAHLFILPLGLNLMPT